MPRVRPFSAPPGAQFSPPRVSVLSEQRSGLDSQDYSPAFQDHMLRDVGVVLRKGPKHRTSRPGFPGEPLMPPSPFSPFWP